MSNFSYGTPKNHSIRYGVYLKLYSESNKQVTNLIYKSNLIRFYETIYKIVVFEYNPEKNIVFLQVWCKSIFDSIRHKQRYNVFYINLPPNPNWICEGDIGTGFVE